MRDPILRDLKLSTSNGKLSADKFDVVVDHLTLFARGGGIVTWSLWRKLKTDTKAAFVAAFERVKAEEAAAIGIASQGPRQAAQILETSDGGELSCELALDGLISKLDRK